MRKRRMVIRWRGCLARYWSNSAWRRCRVVGGWNNERYRLRKVALEENIGVVIKVFGFRGGSE